MTMDFKVGDEVRVLKHGTRYSSGFPEGGYEATVTKVGRKYATATYVRQRTAYPAGPVEETIEFDMATGRERGSASNYGRYVSTPAEVELLARRDTAMAALAARKIRLDSGHGFTLEQIEALAEVVKTWED